MGAIWSRFRKKKTAIEELEEIEKKTKYIEEYRRDSQQKQKRYIGALILYSIIAYIIFCIIFYFYYFPAIWTDRVLHSLPLLLFPVIIWLIKRMLQAYFCYRINQSEDQLTSIRQRRKKILEEVMDKEKYNKAKEILEKFDPTVKYEKEKAAAKAEEIIQSQRSTSEIRHRIMLGRETSPSGSMRPSSALPGLGRGRGYSPNSPVHMQALGYERPPGPPMPRPILPRERNAVDRLIEYIVGDGPNNRLALICKRCFSHNGMALKEEFDYLAYRCCYCHTINPARKQRPQAPKLLDSSLEITELHEESEEGSDGELTVNNKSPEITNIPEISDLTTKVESEDTSENITEIKPIENNENRSEEVTDELFNDGNIKTSLAASEKSVTDVIFEPNEHELSKLQEELLKLE